MIDDSVKIHDKFQFEVKLSYNIEQSKKKTEYQVETYLFFPKSLGVNHHTYTRKDFYRDMQTFIRFKTPVYSLEELSKGLGPLERLKTSVDFEQNVKIFCCVLKSAIRDYLKHTNRDLTYFVEKVTLILESYRSLSVSEANIPVYTFGDEDISLIIEAYCFPLLAALPKNNVKEILELVINEQTYREKKGMPVPKKNTVNDLFLFRKSILKKYVSSVLYLNTTEDREGKLVGEISSGVAAGLAMLIATAIAFYAQVKFGTLTFPLFAAIVVGYVFKDRMKDSLRSYLKHKLARNVFDHKTRIFSGKKAIGTIRDGFDFEKEEKIPEHIQSLRNRDHITEIENSWVGENVIRHIKKICLHTEDLKIEDYKICAINDISRLSITHYLGKMGEPKRSLYVLDKGKLERVDGERMYHINIIMKFTSMDKISYKRLRLVVNRAGIKAIEEVNSDKEEIEKRDDQWKNIMKKLPVIIHLPNK